MEILNCQGLKKESAENKSRTFARKVGNFKWMLNREMPYNENVSRAKLYLTESATAGRNGKGQQQKKKQLVPTRTTTGRDSAKTTQAKFLLLASHQQRIPTWAELIGDQVLNEYNLQFEVNFPDQIFSTISEAQQFEKLGFRICPALRMSVLRKEQLFEDATAVQEMINSYNRTVRGLSLAKVSSTRKTMQMIIFK